MTDRNPIAAAIAEADEACPCDNEACPCWHGGKGCGTCKRCKPLHAAIRKVARVAQEGMRDRAALVADARKMGAEAVGGIDTGRIWTADASGRIADGIRALAVEEVDGDQA